MMRREACGISDAVGDDDDGGWRWWWTEERSEKKCGNGGMESKAESTTEGREWPPQPYTPAD